MPVPDLRRIMADQAVAPGARTGMAGAPKVRQSRVDTRAIVSGQREKSRGADDGRVVVLRKEDKSGPAAPDLLLADIVKLGCNLDGVFVGKGNNVIVRAASKEDAEKFKERIQGFHFVEPGVVKPKLVVFGVPENLAADGEVLKAEIRERNFPEIPNFRARVRLVKTTRERGDGASRVRNVILETDGEILCVMEGKGSLFMGYKSCPVREDVDVLRCFRRGSLDHLVDACPSEGRHCWNCERQGHAMGECRSRANCRNCVSAGRQDVGHRMESFDCPLTRKAEGRRRARINYD